MPRSDERIHDRARGRWRGILAGVGLESRFLTNKHGPCPICGGKDRYRFDDKGGDGTFYCSRCGAGNGVDLVMRVKHVDFINAVRLIEPHVGAAPIVVAKAGRREEDVKEQMAALWARARPLDGHDVASRYLSARGIQMASWPSQLRWIEDLPYFDEETKRKSLHPAMLAKFASPDGRSAILHRTYLAEPGVKASLPKVRMLMPCKIPVGGAVRLGPVAETMGIAEGIETSLSASILFGVPVWAALSAGQMVKWQPPQGAKFILIFGDRDNSFTGQHQAYSLAYRLKNSPEIKGVEIEVRLPEEDICKDWNDVLRLRQEIGEA